MEISTKAAIRQMVVPGLMAVIAPVIVAFLPGFGVEALGGMLAGVTVSGSTACHIPVECRWRLG